MLSRKDRKLTVLIMAIVGLSFGLFVAVESFKSNGDNDSALAPKDLASQDSRHFAAPAAVDRDTSRGRDQPREDGVPPADDHSNPVALSPDGNDGDTLWTGPRSWTVFFQTHEETPVPNLVVAVASRPRAEVDDESNAVRRSLVTDKDGRINVPGHMRHTRVRVETAGWRIAGGKAPNKDGWVPVESPSRLIVEPFRRLSVAARYADGLPFEGSLIVVPHWEDGNEHRPPRRASHYEVVDGGVTVETPSDGPVEIGVHSRRPGFRNASVSVEREAPTDQVLEMILEYDLAPQLGMIEIDLTAFGPQDRVHVSAIWANRMALSNYRAFTNGGAIHTTTGLRPYVYRVEVEERQGGATVMGAPPPAVAPASVRVWQSDVIQVRAGEVTRVVARPEVASAVRARLIDEAGTPLVPGRIFVETEDKYPTAWGFIQPDYARARPGATVWWQQWPGYNGQDGSALLPTVAPGKRVIGAEAPGRDIKFIEVECISGQVLDLGDIQLQPATGVIEVAITNWNAGTRYWVQVHGPGGGAAVTARLEFDGPEYRVEGLSHRFYAVSIGYVGEASARFFARNVELTASEPEVSFAFEMPRPPSTRNED
jgi:hypothetical protein